MLIGQYESKLTDKERISVPKKFREELGEKLVIARWYEKCLVLVSTETWRGLLKRLTGSTDLVIEPIRNIDRFIFGSAYELKPDGQGRFILPGSLKEYADIKNEVIFVGLSDRVEIWDKGEWQKLESEVEEKAAKAVERLAKENH